MAMPGPPLAEYREHHFAASIRAERAARRAAAWRNAAWFLLGACYGGLTTAWLVIG